MLFFLLLTNLTVLSFASKISRVCDPDKANPHYTGFRVDKQILIDSQVKAVETHLSLCKEGQLITDIKFDGKFNDSIIDLDTGIPWNETLCAGDVCYKISRRKVYALRPLAFYAPSNFVGGLFEYSKNDDESKDENYRPIAKLVSDTIYNQWIEISKDSSIKLYHIPLLYTPDVDDRLYKNQVDREANGDWFKVVSATESYNYSVEARDIFRKGVDLTLGQIKSVVKNTNKRLKSLNDATGNSIPLRRSIRAVNGPKNFHIFHKIFANKIEDLSKCKISRDNVDFGTLMVLSKILPKFRYEQLLKSL